MMLTVTVVWEEVTTNVPSVDVDPEEAVPKRGGRVIWKVPSS
jgi:hypothetical protein